MGFTKTDQAFIPIPFIRRKEVKSEADVPRFGIQDHDLPDLGQGLRLGSANSKLSFLGLAR